MLGARTPRGLGGFPAMSRLARALVRGPRLRSPVAHPRAVHSLAPSRLASSPVAPSAMLDDLLARFATNHERTGVPRNAASAHEASGDFDLARMRRLLRALGDPHERYPVVHVAGTKGKGSVVSLLAGVLRAAGKRRHVQIARALRVRAHRLRRGNRTSARADRAEAKRVPRDVARVWSPRVSPSAAP